MISLVFFFLVKKLLFCCLKMEGVGVYVATIHDKNAFKQFQIKP